MELTVATFEVQKVLAGSETKWEAGSLTINLDELKKLLLEDELFLDVEIEIVRPGENVRIIHAIDVVEPRVKVSPTGSDFPGLLSDPKTNGEGLTHRIAGLAVVDSAPAVPGEPIHWREAIIDMTGPGAAYSPFSNTVNIVLHCIPKPERYHPDAVPINMFEGTPESSEFGHAVRLAGLRAAVYLAQTTLDLEPDRIEVFNLDVDRNPELPNIIYLYQTTMPYLYGEQMPGGGAIGDAAHLPVVIHPNEVLDGAMANAWNAVACMRDATYLIQNHAIVLELMRRNGVDLNFIGMMVYTNGDNEASKERLTSYAANLARILGADGAVLNYCGGGHPGVDVMMALARLEKLGIKTVLLANEMASNPEESGFVHFEPEADAIVSLGNYELSIELPPLGTLLGGTHILTNGADASQPMELTLSHFYASTNQFGFSKLRGRQF
jgi:glycine reductase complex component B subunit alpha and beta